jgi:hypothetical protein
MASVGSAKVEAVRFAYEYDNDVNVVTDEGDTLMHASVTGTANGGTQEAQQRIVEVIEFLCDRGAKPDELNNAGRTPTDLADGLPIDKAIIAFSKYIFAAGGYPKHPSKRRIGLPPPTR